MGGGFGGFIFLDEIMRENVSGERWNMKMWKIEIGFFYYQFIV